VSLSVRYIMRTVFYKDKVGEANYLSRPRISLNDNDRS